MYPISNINGQQSAGQPAQPTLNQGDVNSQVGNQQVGAPQPSLNPADLTAPVYDGQSARTQPLSANLRIKSYAAQDASTKSGKQVPSELQQLVRAAEELALVAHRRFSKKAAPAQPQKEKAPIQQQFEESMSLQKQILDLLQKSIDDSKEPEEPVSCRIAMERLRALKKDGPIARKNASMVFIYDIEDITQLSPKIISAVRRMFPNLKNVSYAIEDVFEILTEKFFEYSQDEDYYNDRINLNDGDLGAKIGEYLEFKKKCKESGSNFCYELIKTLKEEDMDYDDEDEEGEDECDDETSEDDPFDETSEEQIDECDVVEFQKVFAQLWQSSKKCLQAISDKSLKQTYENVVLCNMIGYGAGKLLLSNLESEVPLENLYSYSMSPKERVLERIQRDYRDECVLVVVSSNAETIAAAEKKDILVWPVEDEKSLDALYTAQKSQLLK